MCFFPCLSPLSTSSNKETLINIDNSKISTKSSMKYFAYEIFSEMFFVSSQIFIREIFYTA